MIVVRPRKKKRDYDPDTRKREKIKSKAWKQNTDGSLTYHAISLEPVLVGDQTHWRLQGIHSAKTERRKSFERVWPSVLDAQCHVQDYYAVLIAMLPSDVYLARK